MKKFSIVVYNNILEKIAFLSNVTHLSYDITLNVLYTAEFEIPATDEITKIIKPQYYVELYDNEKRVELFQIQMIEFVRGELPVYKYVCRHVINTLSNFVIFQALTLKENEYNTAGVITQILNNQKVSNWVLSKCEFDEYNFYHFEKQDLLTCLIDIVKLLQDEYIWDYDTTQYPWELRLLKKKNSSQTIGDIVFGREMTNIEKIVDYTNLVTRVYPIGAGEGSNQLTIKNVNEGIPFIDSDNIKEYGLKEFILVDRRFYNSNSLKNYAYNLLKEFDTPFISYKVKCLEIFQNIESNLKVGEYIKIIDNEYNIVQNVQIIRISKKDTINNPLYIEIELGNRKKTIFEHLENTDNRIRVNEIYQQGCDSTFSSSFGGNCSSNIPQKGTLVIPKQMVQVNSIKIYFNTQAYRMYSTVANMTTSPTVTYTGNTSSISTVYSGDSNPTTPHKHSIAHIHNISHTHTIPNHIHGSIDKMTAGSYGEISKMLVVGGLDINNPTSGMEISHCFPKNSNGKIIRDKMYEIAMFANENSNVVATIVVQGYMINNGELSGDL